MNDIDKKTHAIILFDYYGCLLTQKQQDLFQSYYLNDYSLSEIATEHDISRNAVHDSLRKVLTYLEDYENKLHLHRNDQLLQQLLDEASASEWTVIELVNKIKEME